MRRMLFPEQQSSPALIAKLQAIAHPLQGPRDLDVLIRHIGNSRYVLLGEASHGTAEYYAWRTEISRRLILEQGFSFIAVEGDWPDCYRVNRYVKDLAESGENARDVLHAFTRWPTWMWANTEIVDLIEWLRQHNEKLPEERRIGLFGLDVYSLWDSLYQVMGYLRQHDPRRLAAARQAFQCFEPYGEDVQDYARATRWVNESCENEVVTMLAELRRTARHSHDHDGEASFNAEQNALVVKNAEHYYRTMVQGGPASWNIRDRHMTETLERLMRHHGPTAKGIVWEHNTHIGDARFTDMVEDGTINVGQLIRERHGDEGVALIGFGSYQGFVIAGSEWEAPMQRMQVPPARKGSWENILHEAGASDKLLLFVEADQTHALLQPRGHRAIGVVYHPDYEVGNYVPTILPRRYDAFLYLDRTEALHPLHDGQVQDVGEIPETFPSGV